MKPEVRSDCRWLAAGSNVSTYSPERERRDVLLFLPNNNSDTSTLFISYSGTIASESNYRGITDDDNVTYLW